MIVNVNVNVHLPVPLPVPQICARESGFRIAGAAMEYSFGYGYVHVYVYVHDARRFQLFIIGAPKYYVIFRSNAEFAE
jgi:hypothetical protein